MFCQADVANLFDIAVARGELVFAIVGYVSIWKFWVSLASDDNTFDPEYRFCTIVDLNNHLIPSFFLL